jgi:hypothetical protein
VLVSRPADAIGTKVPIRIEVAMEVGHPPTPLHGPPRGTRPAHLPPLRDFPAERRAVEAAEKHVGLCFLRPSPPTAEAAAAAAALPWLPRGW